MLFFLCNIGCGAIDSLLTIEISETSQVMVEQGTVLESLLGDLGFGDFVSMDLTDSQALANQGVEPGDIERVTLTVLELEAIEPAGADLSFLEQMVFYASSPDVEEVKIASSPGFPEGEPLVVFDIEDVNLTPYVVSESMTLSTDVTAQRPEQDTLVEARFTVEVQATVQGAKNQLD
jgi:hypothetical protein